MEIQEEREDARTENGPVTSAFSKRPRLSILLLWGLAPGIAITLAGLCMEFRISGLDAVFLFGGMLGGPVVLLVWSLRILWPLDMKAAVKVLLAIPLTIGACAVNLFLGAGACSIIEPPFLH